MKWLVLYSNVQCVTIDGVFLFLTSRCISSIQSFNVLSLARSALSHNIICIFAASEQGKRMEVSSSFSFASPSSLVWCVSFYFHAICWMVIVLYRFFLEIYDAA